MDDNYKIGVISDTHGLLRPEAIKYLTDSDLILHAGDIGHIKVMEELRQIAPVIAVRGNSDYETWAYTYDLHEFIEIRGIGIYLIHDLQGLDIDPETAGVRIILSGHTHIPSLEIKKGVLYFNPGSAGPQRYNKPVSLGKIFLQNNQIETERIEIKGSIHNLIQNQSIRIK